MAYIVGERASQGPLVYGVRKSYFLQTKPGGEDLRSLIRLKQKEKDPGVERLTQIANLIN
jgi:hypothetical protein